MKHPQTTAFEQFTEAIAGIHAWASLIGLFLFIITVPIMIDGVLDGEVLGIWLVPHIGATLAPWVHAIGVSALMAYSGGWLVMLALIFISAFETD